MPGCAGVGIQSLQLQLWGAHECHCTATALQPNPRMLVSRTEYPASKMFEGSFEVLGNGEMRVRVECCIWEGMCKIGVLGPMLLVNYTVEKKLNQQDGTQPKNVVSLQLDWELAEGRC